MTEQLLPVVLDPLIGGLEDNDDDVRAVSAAALLPVVEEIILIMSDKVKGDIWMATEEKRITSLIINYMADLVLRSIRKITHADWLLNGSIVYDIGPNR